MLTMETQVRNFSVLILFLVIFSVISQFQVLGARLNGNPYEILGIKRSATAQDVRKAYKKLAVIWHPDKNQGEESKEKFLQITAAYELLSDPERRRNYDQKGITEEFLNTGPRRKDDFKVFDPLDEIFTFATGGSFHFPFADGLAFLHKQSVTSKTFEQTILPKSSKIPQLILFYGDWCTGCVRAAPVWRSISDELATVGMDVLCVHLERERDISRRMGISSVPSVILLIDGHPYHYRETIISAAKVVAFIRAKLPYDLMLPLNEGNINAFLSSWKDNKIRAVIFGTQNTIRLRYLLLALRFRDRAAFGFVKPEESQALRARFGLPKSLDGVLVFKEHYKPVASLSMADIPTNLMVDLIENNKFLYLPRLSSQNEIYTLNGGMKSVMDSLCPTETSVYRRRLCIVFLTTDKTSDEDDGKVEELRRFAQKPSIPVRVKFAYLYKDKQREFVSSLSIDGEKQSNLVVIWRQNSQRLAYEWLEGGWDGTNASADRLDNVIQRLITEPTKLTHHVLIKELTDEHAQSLFTKVLRKVSLTMEFVRGQITKDMVIQTTSLVATVLFIVAGGYIMNYLVRLEEESIVAKANAESRSRRAERSASSSRVRQSSTSSTRTSATSTVASVTQNPECRIHELRSESYNGLVRLIKPGCRTVILLVDNDTKATLLPKFQRCVWPYRKNKSLQFAFMHVDRGGGLNWYKQLLLLSLSEPRNLNINPRNCVGTVLSLNGYRKYFCVFHATLPTARARSGSGYRNGGFLGFDSENSSDDNTDVETGPRTAMQTLHESSGVLFTNHLLDNLSNWLDRLFEGSTHRYHIKYWPDFLVK